ncbi:hypothetical protein D3C84_1252130 [compost metagenome]
MFEHFVAAEWHQADGFVTAVAAGRQVDALTQADQVALLQVEKGAFIDDGVDQAVLDQEQLVGRQQG